jgi:hypothetical protein
MNWPCGNGQAVGRGEEQDRAKSHRNNVANRRQDYENEGKPLSEITSRLKKSG